MKLDLYEFMDDVAEDYLDDVDVAGIPDDVKDEVKKFLCEIWPDLKKALEKFRDSLKRKWKQLLLSIAIWAVHRVYKRVCQQ